MADADKWEVRIRGLVVYDIWLCMHWKRRLRVWYICYGPVLLHVKIDGALGGDPYLSVWIWLYSKNPRNIPLSMYEYPITSGKPQGSYNCIGCCL